MIAMVADESAKTITLSGNPTGANSRKKPILWIKAATI
jgi:hypothetical protein